MANPPEMQALGSARDRAAFVLGLRARGISGTGRLRSLESVPREMFVPHRFADLAARPVALPPAGASAR